MEIFNSMFSYDFVKKDGRGEGGKWGTGVSGISFWDHELRLKFNKLSGLSDRLCPALMTSGEFNISHCLSR